MSDEDEERYADDLAAAYADKRAEAQARLIRKSMDARRFGGPPMLCDMDYGVLDR
jgi:hypothetical protein